MSTSFSPDPFAPIFDRPSVAFFGRSFTEYCGFLALDPDRLRQRPVLDVAAGPSSFTAEACDAGVDAVAVDPLYGCRPEALAAHVQMDYDYMLRRMKQHPGRFVRRTYASIDEAMRDRRAAAARFLVDYEAHVAHRRYVGGALPDLPFAERTFDLVLCAHLLFIYDQLGFDFHLSACRELVRVSRGEARIHPVCGADGRPFPGLPRLVEALARTGIAARLVPVDFEFLSGTNSMLVLARSDG